MENHEQLCNLILTHWQKHQPKMVAQFQQENRLEKELETTAKRWNDMLHRLVMQKMDYKTAWVIVSKRFLLLEEPEESSSTTPPASPPATV
jgi:hypothetical protein